jgi:cyclopropane fatty-acyl-phospholipid synthase-like methyltransferase
VSTLAVAAAIYKDGRYLEQHPLWHTEHSAWKAAQVVRMIHRAKLQPKTVCEVGCGAGEVLRHVQDSLGPDCRLQGFDISPQAIGLCQPRANERLQFSLIQDEGDLPAPFDLLISVDVIEHIEDYLGHLRRLRSKATYKIFHVPLDLSVQTVLRAGGLMERRASHAHLHYFTKVTFLRSLADLGYEVRDVVFTKRSIEIGSGVGQRLMNLPRKLGFKLLPDLTVRVLGGFSLAVLAV